MSLFRCEQCGCIENTATSNYWSRKYRRGRSSAEKPGDTRLLCSECDPEIGKWHGRFPRQSANGWLIDAQGFIWHPDTDPKDITHTKILDKVPGERGPEPEHKPKPPKWKWEEGDE